MNRDIFRKLKGNETVNINDKWKGATRGRQGTVVKVIDKAKGTVKVKFLNLKTPSTYHYSYLDLVEEEKKEETTTVTKMETTVENTDQVGSDNLETKTEAPEVEEKDEASTSTEAGS